MVLDKIITPEEIMEIVSDFLGIPIEDIKSRRRFGKLVEARILAASMMYSYTDLNLGSIAVELGMDFIRHDAVIHYLKEVDLRSSQSKLFTKKLDEIESRVIRLISNDLSIEPTEVSEDLMTKSKFVHVIMDSINWEERGTTREAIEVAYYNIFIKKEFNNQIQN